MCEVWNEKDWHMSSNYFPTSGLSPHKVGRTQVHVVDYIIQIQILWWSIKLFLCHSALQYLLTDIVRLNKGYFLSQGFCLTFYCYSYDDVYSSASGPCVITCMWCSLPITKRNNLGNTVIAGAIWIKLVPPGAYFCHHSKRKMQSFSHHSRIFLYFSWITSYQIIQHQNEKLSYDYDIFVMSAAAFVRPLSCCTFLFYQQYKQNKKIKQNVCHWF